MPIIIPTVQELARMNSRQRAAVAKRLKHDLTRIAQSVEALDRGRLDGLRIVADAREIKKALGSDPDAAEHVAALLRAIA